ncbi:hypothetical protein ACHWQZ_G008976 [Mnemiopsis leidyi]
MGDVEELEVQEIDLDDEDFSCEVTSDDEATAAVEEEVDMCGMCDAIIDGQYLTALDCKFHPDCFVCVNCKTKIAPGQDFFERNDKPLCVDCHYLLYGYKCKVCNEFIKGQRLCWGDDAFHFQCVKCTGCSKTLCETDDLKVVNKKDFIHVACC